MQVKLFFGLLFIFSCTSGDLKYHNTDSLPVVKHEPNDYKSILFIDSFFDANKVKILQSEALRKNYEAICTKQMLPLIDKKGLYDDLPLEFTASTIHNGKAYGNFVFRDERHFIKVTCIINKNLLDSLIENKKYYIKFKTFRFSEGVSFEPEFRLSKTDSLKIRVINLPTVSAQLISFENI